MKVVKLNTSTKTNEMCEGEEPLWTEHICYHHIIFNDNGVIVGYIYDDEDEYELITGQNPNYTIESLKEDPLQIWSAGMQEWDSANKCLVDYWSTFHGTQCSSLCNRNCA